jgi:hypothetical protein
VREADRHLTERGELLLVQELAQVLGEADGAVLLAVLVDQNGAGDRDRNLLAGLGQERGAEGLDDPLAAVLRAPHRGRDALRFFEARVELAHEGAEHLGLRVAEARLRTVVVVDDDALAVGRHHDVGGACDQLLEPLFGERNGETPLRC